MQSIKIEGIVIKEKKYKETSKILTIITKDKKIISVISKGCMNLKSNLRSISGIFTYANFIINYKEDTLSTLINADIINNLSNIKTDIEKISYLNFICELTSQVMRQSDSNDIYKLLIDSILKINDGYDAKVITNILELKLLKYLGVSPKFNGCIICNNQNVVTLSSSKGGFVCKNHLDNEYIVKDKTIKLIKLLEYVDISKISKLDISDDVKNEINDFIDDYYDRYTGLYLKSKNFLKKILIK